MGKICHRYNCKELLTKLFNLVELRGAPVQMVHSAATVPAPGSHGVAGRLPQSRGESASTHPSRLTSRHPSLHR